MEFLNNLRLGVMAALVVANTVLAVFVYKNNPTGKINRLYGVLSLITSMWVVAMYASENPLFAPANLFWMRLSIFLAVPQSAFFFLLARALPDSDWRLSKKFLTGLTLSALAVMILTMSPYAFTGFEIINSDPRPIPGPGLAAFAIFVGSLSAAAVYFLLKKQKEASGLKKQQLRLVLAGIFLMLSLIIVTIMIPVVIFEFDFFAPFSPIYVLIFLGLTAYAIVRHHLFDLRVVVARAVMFLGFIFILGLAYAAIFFSGAAKIFGFQLDWPIFLVILALTAAAAITFQPLQELLRKITNRIFFARRYDPDKLLTNLTHALSNNIDLDSMSDEVIGLLAQEMKIGKAAFLIVDHPKIVDVKGVGYAKKSVQSRELEELLHGNLKINSYFVLENLTEGPLKEAFRKFDISVAIPIRTEVKEVAVLALGPKLSGEAYEPADINLLGIFASGAGIAIENARLYSDLKVLSESKSKFISVVSHQLRTPVSGIRWSLEMLRDNSVGEKERGDFLENSYQSIVFLGEQLDDIITALDIYDKKIFVKKQPCDLYGICNTITNDLSQLVKTKKVNLAYTIDNDANDLPADRAKLEKIISTLLKNAVVYSSPGGRITVTARQDVSAQHRRFVVSVSDGGMGIAHDERDHICEEFFRGERARKLWPDGLGLGMFITRAFIKAHGGDLWFYSEGEGRGSNFHFSIPA